MKITLGVAGSIAAYKAADIINRLKEEHQINVVMTNSATKFITPLTLEVLSQNKVSSNVFEAEDVTVSHVELGTKADLILVAPITANLIGKMAHGLADDMLSTILIAADPHKVIIAPAMNTKMYENKIVQENIKKLQNLGVKVIEPRVALLACNEYGQGALAKVEDIVKVVKEYHDIN